MKGQARKTTKSKTPIDDEAIIELYWERDDRAIEETDFKYGKYLFSVAYNIVHDRLDCEECVNDTYLGVWNTVPPTRPNELRAFLTTIMRRVAVNRYHHNKRKSAPPSELTLSLSELEDFISDTESVESAFDAERLGRVLSDFIRSLSDRRKYIFMSRYYTADQIGTIAKELNLSRSMINKELAAIRASLKEKLESEGYAI